MKNIVVLGSTGSVGKSVLAVAKRHPDKFRVMAIASRSNAELLAEQANEFRPAYLAIADETLPVNAVGKKNSRGVKVLRGNSGMEELASLPGADMVFLAISGRAALKPLLAAIKAGKTIALASKEPIVSAGEILMKMARKHNARIIPVDSEHSAVMQCLGRDGTEKIRTIYLTGSGGSLRKTPQKDFKKMTVDKALAHPKWNMGKKITIDSATLMNKGLEVIEARWLFSVDPKKIRVVIHPEAIIHAMVEFVDGTVRAGMFQPDMRFPVLRALAYPDVMESALPRIDLLSLGKLTFEAPDLKKFPALELAYGALDKGGTMPAVMNAANETAVKMFLEGRSGFTEIIEKVKKVMRKHKVIAVPSIEDIIAAEDWSAEEAESA
jgi:1-deoxy-D-xylulose-5-phosphate reductoisomerase